MIVKYRGTDPHGKFVMGVKKFPDHKSFLAWVDSHEGWQEFLAFDGDGRGHTPWAF